MTISGKKGLNIRLCVVSALYHPSLGGLGRQAQLLTERLAEEGIDIFVIARRMKGMPQAVFSPKVKVYRAWSIKSNLHNFEEVRFVNIMVSLTFSFSCAILLFLKRKKYDIVHFHGASLPLFFNLPLLKILRKKVIAKVAAAKIGTEAGALQGRYLGLGNLIIRLLQRVDAFVATTAEIEEGLRGDGLSATKISRIPNFVDFALFAFLSTEIKNPLKVRMGFGNSPLVTFSGRFIPRKGINFLLRAWKEVIKDFPDARLLFLGDGPLLCDMEKMARDLDIIGSVDFRGHINNITNFLHATDIFVLPSLQEGMPNSLLEAMACGLPVVATQIGGVVDVVKDGENGVLVEPGNYHDLAKGILKLLRGKEFARRIAFNAFCSIKKFYSLDNIARKYIELYKELLAA
ncbi:MAG: hypothetical protein A2073_01525 [Deltaproteobacteria bacterium GWC2_42_11]|nr:MAG: hypothetical protein A2073_01525 [Deltaproteobacteria bacterium GWC2_42_11]HBO84301.1 hypothetical protein [Deltaproteobacteria bacterium]